MAISAIPLGATTPPKEPSLSDLLTQVETSYLERAVALKSKLTEMSGELSSEMRDNIKAIDTLIEEIKESRVPNLRRMIGDGLSSSAMAEECWKLARGISTLRRCIDELAVEVFASKSNDAIRNMLSEFRMFWIAERLLTLRFESEAVPQTRATTREGQKGSNRQDR